MREMNIVDELFDDVMYWHLNDLPVKEIRIDLEVSRLLNWRRGFYVDPVMPVEELYGHRVFVDITVPGYLIEGYASGGV